MTKRFNAIQITYWTLIALVTIGVAVFNMSCGDNKSTPGFDADSVWQGSWTRRNETRTKKEAYVYSANAVNPALLPLIDVGIDKLAVTARLENYQPMAHNEFIVALFPRSRHCIAPGFLIADPSNTWDNLPPPNDFDKDQEQHSERTQHHPLVSPSDPKYMVAPIHHVHHP